MAELKCCSKCLGKATCTDPEHCRAAAIELAEMLDSASPECPDSKESKKCSRFPVAFGDSYEYATRGDRGRGRSYADYPHAQKI